MCSVPQCFWVLTQKYGVSGSMKRPMSRTHHHVCNRQQSPVSLLLCLWEAGEWKGIWFQTGVWTSEGSLLTVLFQNPVKSEVMLSAASPQWCYRCVKELRTDKYLFIHAYLFVCIFHSRLSVFGAVGYCYNKHMACMRSCFKSQFVTCSQSWLHKKCT